MLRIDNLAPETDTIIVSAPGITTTVSRDEDGCIHVVVVYNKDSQLDNPSDINVVEKHLVLGVEGELK